MRRTHAQQGKRNVKPWKEMNEARLGEVDCHKQTDLFVMHAKCKFCSAPGSSQNLHQVL
jgi:hypothetical protein